MLQVIMNMNKPPDETLKQGRSRSWLLLKRKESENVAAMVSIPQT